MLEKDNDREDRIDLDVIVDAYGSDERAMGWYYYVSDNCNFPIKAKCINERRSSPLQLKDEVEVLDTSPADECEKEMFVDINWNNRLLAVPLSQLEGIDTDSQTKTIIDDWHYWIARGYEF